RGARTTVKRVSRPTRAASTSPAERSTARCLAIAWRVTGRRSASAVAVTGPSSATARRTRRRVASARAVKTASAGSAGCSAPGAGSGDAGTGGHEQQLEAEEAPVPAVERAPGPPGRPGRGGDRCPGHGQPDLGDLDAGAAAVEGREHDRDGGGVAPTVAPPGPHEPL